MKIVITGSLGNVSKALAEILLPKGHLVTIVTSDPKKVSAIKAMGARPAVGSISGAKFLAKSFKGADVVYTMVPPNWGVSDYKNYIRETGAKYREAIVASGVTRVVNLSSMGAHLEKGTGAIAGLHDVEQTLDSLTNVAVKHLRPGLFFTNFFFDIPTIQKAGVMGNNYGADTKLVIAHPRDIAEAAAEELLEAFEGKSHRYVASEQLKVAEAVRILGSAIGKPELPWLQFSDEDTLGGMVASGMSNAIAELYVEMGRAIGSGILFEDFNRTGSKRGGRIRLAEFAKEFAAVYSAQAKVR